MKTKHYQLRFANLNEFATTLESTLQDLGIDTSEIEIDARGDLVARFEVVEEIEGQEFTRKERLVLNWHPSAPKELDEEGEFIATAVDEEGNPTAWALYPGYHVELFSNRSLDLPAQFVMQPAVKQYRKA